MPKTKKKVSSAAPAKVTTTNVRVGFAIMSILFILSFVFYAFVMFVMNTMSVQYGNRITELESKVTIQRALINAITPAGATK